MDIKNIITKKAHEISVKGLSNVPESIQEYLSMEFMENIASALTSITRDKFNYTGKIIQEENSLNIAFTSSSQKDTVDLIITYGNGAMKFININEKLEQALENEDTEVDIELDDIEPQTQVDDFITPTNVPDEDISDKTDIDVKEEPYPKLLDLFTKVVEEDKKKDEEKKKEKMLDDLTKALKTLEIREEFKKKEAILDKIIKQESNGQKNTTTNK
jgi:hypothetical protein